MSRATLAVLGLWLATAGALVAQTVGEEVRDPVVDSLAASVVGEEVPGLAVLVVHEGRVVHRAAYGVRSLASGEPMTVHTPFYIASTAKMFTAAAVLALIEDGRLGLEDPIGRYVPTVPEYARNLTIRQILTHTSGLPDHYDIAGEERTYSNDDVLEILRQAGGLLFEPGSDDSYSNSGYVLLALLIEELEGSFSRVLENRFFEPLEMGDAVVALDGARPAVRAIGHRKVEGGFAEWDYASSTIGAGGVYASLSDLEQWYRALREERVLEAATLRLASRPPALRSGKLTPYGMGWLAEFAGSGPLQDRWYVLAFGSLRGFRAVFQWYQEDDLLLVWLANGDSEAVLGALHGVPEHLLAPSE